VLFRSREAVGELKRAVQLVREQSRLPVASPGITLPQESIGWNFTTFEKFMNQRFTDLSMNLRERYEAQQTGLVAALAAAEKAVNAALIAAEKAVDKAEGAQQLRNEAQNEFRKSLSDLSGLMWTIKEGQGTVDALRREFNLAQQTLVDRTTKLENDYSNLQGRMWAISALWAVAVVSVSIAIRFIGHN
jgi:hypothetical protein